jgi:hypothetical protein
LHVKNDQAGKNLNNTAPGSYTRGRVGFFGGICPLKMAGKLV